MFIDRAIDAGLREEEIDKMYVSSVWRYINSYLRKEEERLKWDFQMTRLICHTIHLHTPLRTHQRNAEKFMPSPWGKAHKPQIAKSNKEVWEAYERMKEERRKKESK